MNIRMKVQHIDIFKRLANKPRFKETWEEQFNTETTNCLADAPKCLEATEYAQMVVDYFNSTLKRGELERTLISAYELRDIETIKIGTRRS